MKYLLILVLFLAPQLAWSQAETIAHDSDASTTANGTTGVTGGVVQNVSTISWTHTIVSNTHGAVCVFWYMDTSYANPSVQSVTFGALNPIVTVGSVVTGTYWTVSAYCFTGISTGANTVTVVLSTNLGSTRIAFGGSVAFTHVSQYYPLEGPSGPLNVVTTTAGAVTTISQNITTIAANAWIVDGLAQYVNSQFFPNGSQVSSSNQWSGINSEGMGISYHGPIVTPASTVDSWTASGNGDHEGLITFSLRPYGSGEPPPPPPVLFVRKSSAVSNNTGTLSPAFTSNTAGNTILVFMNGANQGATIPSATDSAGNTYTLKVYQGCNNYAGPYYGQAVLEADNIAASAGTNTLTITAAAVTYDVLAMEYTGLATPAFDQFMCNWNPTATTVSSGSTLLTSYASELLIDDFASDGTAVTVTDGSTTRSATSGNWRDTYTDSQVTATGKYAATGTGTSAPNVFAGMATFRLSGASLPATPAMGGPLASSFLPSIDTNPGDYPANVWVTDSLSKVRQDSATPGPNKWITIFGTQNEFVDFQVHFQDTGSGTTGLKITIGNFVQSSPTSATINCATLGQCIDYREAYMHVTIPSETGPTTLNALGYIPDILIPATDPYWGQTTNAWPFTVSASNNQSAWFDVHIPSSAAPGYYQATVTIQTGCPGSCVTLTTLPIILGVWQWPSSGSMPSQPTLITEESGSSWYAGFCTQMYTGNGLGGVGSCTSYPDSGGNQDNAIDQILEDAILVMKDHRYHSGYTSYSYPGTGSFSSYVTLAGPNMNGTCRHSGSYCPLLTGAKNDTKAFGLTMGQSYSTSTYSNFQSNFVSNGWGTAGHLPLYDYLADEPSDGAWATLVTNGTTRHSYIAPSLPELVTTDIASATTNGALNAIDIMVPELIIFEPLGGSSTRSSYNSWLSGNANNCGSGMASPCSPRLLWSYIDCLQLGTCVNNSIGGQTYQPNYAVDGTPAANRAMEWITFLHNQTGELYYTFDYCAEAGTTNCGYPTHPEDPWASNYAFGNWGDGTLIYPGCTASGQNCYMGAGVTTPLILPSIRLKHMRDGVQDYEYLYYLSNHGFSSLVTTQLTNWIANSYTFENSGIGLQTSRTTLGAQLNALTYPPGPTYYISSSTGADTNTSAQAHLKSSPWAHLPGMVNATSNASSYVAQPGDVFILMGCDVWYNASFPVTLSHGGSTGNVVTIGVDPTWYNSTNCPSKWNRPVFDAHTSSGSSTPTQIGGTLSGCHGGGFNEFVNFSASYITLDNIEMRNLFYQNDAENTCYGGNSFWQVNSADYVTVSNSYEHAWSMGTYNASTSNDTDTLVFVNGSPACPHCLLTNNVADNCATTSGSGTLPGGALNMINVKYSVFKCMSNAYKPTQSGEFGWNNISFIGASPDTTIHPNCIETLSAIGNSGIYYIHDNRVHDNYECEGLQVGNPSETDYVWGNIWYNNTAVGANGPQVPQSETPVAMYFWNNTVVGWSTGCIGSAGHGYTWSGAFQSRNNLCINTSGTASSGSPTSSPAAVISNNVGLTTSTATSDGYTASQSPYVYFPTSVGSPSVGVGTNLTSSWPAGFAVQDSSYLCTEQTVATVIQSVCSGSPIARPASGAWDSGSYEFSGVPPTPNPPTSLLVISLE